MKKTSKKKAKKKVTKKARSKAPKKKAKKKTAQKIPRKTGVKKKAPRDRAPSSKPNPKTAEEELTVKQRLFGDEYLKDFNGARAYKDIYKCSQKAAEANASRLLKTVRMQSYLQKRIANMQTTIAVNVENILRECGRIALSDPIDAFNDDGTVKRIQDIPIDLRRAMSSFKLGVVFEGEGEDRKRIDFIKEIKFWSKANQLGLLARHLGLLEKGNRGHSTEDELVNLMKEIAGAGAGLPINKDKK